jgi:hypothetical protein
MKLLNLIVFSHYNLDSQMPKGYLPILAGADLLDDADLEKVNRKIKFYLTDADGINVSKLNPYYSEYSSLYNVWKNYDDFDFVSVNHYRRYFIDGPISKVIFYLFNIIRPLGINKVLKDLDKDQIILPRKVIFSQSLREQYSIYHYEDDFEVLEKVIQKDFQDYFETFRNYINSKEFYPYNMFILKKKDFFEYMEWIFDVFSIIENQINPDLYDAYQKRVYGYLAERLLPVFFINNGKKIIEYDLIITSLGFKDRLKVFTIKLLKKMTYFKNT